MCIDGLDVLLRCRRVMFRCRQVAGVHEQIPFLGINAEEKGGCSVEAGVPDFGETVVVTEIVIDAGTRMECEASLIKESATVNSYLSVERTIKGENVQAVEVYEHYTRDDRITPVWFLIEADAEITMSLAVAQRLATQVVMAAIVAGLISMGNFSEVSAAPMNSVIFPKDLFAVSRNSLRLLDTSVPFSSSFESI